MSTPGSAARIGVDALDLDHTLRPRSHRTVVLVLRVDECWREVARFASSRAAATELDERVAGGARPDEYAVVPLPRTPRQVVLLAAEIVAGLVLVFVVSFVLAHFVIV